MRTYDFSPLPVEHRFDRLFRLIETAQRAAEETYPWPISNVSPMTGTRYLWRSPGSRRSEVSITAEQNASSRRHQGRKEPSSSIEDLDPAVQAAVQAWADYAVQVKGAARQRLAQDRTGQGNPRGHEAPSDRR